MQFSRIFHGGGIGKGSGFISTGAPVTKMEYVRVWLDIADLSNHSANPANGPATRVLPNTLNTRVYAFSPSELDLVYCLIPVSSIYWTYAVTAPTSCTIRLYWYNEVTSSPNVVCWRAEMNFIRETETLNFALPFLTDLNRFALNQYILNVSSLADFPINNPSGSALIEDGIFYFKCGRDGANALDTFASEVYLLGVTIDFPILY